jgi:hypothetical protein
MGKPSVKPEVPVDRPELPYAGPKSGSSGSVSKALAA